MAGASRWLDACAGIPASTARITARSPTSTARCFIKILLLLFRCVDGVLRSRSWASLRRESRQPSECLYGAAAASDDRDEWEEPPYNAAMTDSTSSVRRPGGR